MQKNRPVDGYCNNDLRKSRAVNTCEYRRQSSREKSVVISRARRRRCRYNRIIDFSCCIKTLAGHRERLSRLRAANQEIKRHTILQSCQVKLS